MGMCFRPGVVGNRRFGRRKGKTAPGGRISGQCNRNAMGLILGKLLEMRRLKVN